MASPEIDKSCVQTELFMDRFVVILANGAFPKTAKVMNYIKKAERLVCCDGAVNKVFAHGLTPDFIVGDLDSISPELKKRFSNKIVHVPEQESNDLSKAFNYCLSKDWKDLVILGASGEREDHLLGNVSLLADFALEADSIQMITDYGRFCVATSSGVFHARIGQQISIFSLDPQQEITSQGLKYPLKNLRLPRWHMATLNEALEEKFSLVFTPEAPLILYFAD